MQPATHPSLKIRTEEDALKVLEAVRLGLLPLVTRPLSIDERGEAVGVIKAGAVFVWEERETFPRWLDGIRWLASKCHGEFLIYEEPSDEPSPYVGGAEEGGALGVTRRAEPVGKHDGLIKQTYTTKVMQVTEAGTFLVKWHLVAYSRPSTWASLPTADNDPILRDIRVVPGFFRSMCEGASYPLPHPLVQEALAESVQELAGGLNRVFVGDVHALMASMEGLLPV